MNTCRGYYRPTFNICMLTNLSERLKTSSRCCLTCFEISLPYLIAQSVLTSVFNRFDLIFYFFTKPVQVFALWVTDTVAQIKHLNAKFKHLNKKPNENI